MSNLSRHHTNHRLNMTAKETATMQPLSSEEKLLLHTFVSEMTDDYPETINEESAQTALENFIRRFDNDPVTYRREIVPSRPVWEE